MNINDIILLNISREDVLEAIRKAKTHHFIDNLRNRHIIVSFDSKVRGYLGEIAIEKWLVDKGINRFRTNTMDDNMYACDVDLEIITDSNRFNCEIKTSKTPDYTHNNLQRVIDDCDIKIIKRQQGDNICIDRDIYIQIYYHFPTREHDSFLINRYNESGVNIFADVDDIYETYGYERYLNNTYFVAWEERNNITQRLQSMNYADRVYQISKRTFYTCKLRDSIEPLRLIDFINNN